MDNRFSKEEIEELENAMKVIMKRVNRMGGENEMAVIMADILVRDHRTLQQSFWRVISHIMKLYATHTIDNGWKDLRNEDSAYWCKEAIKLDSAMMRNI